MSLWGWVADILVLSGLGTMAAGIYHSIGFGPALIAAGAIIVWLGFTVHTQIVNGGEGRE